MMKQIKLLLTRATGDFLGLNTLRHTKDPKAKRRFWLLAVAWALVLVMAVGYAALLSQGLISLGLADILPGYLAMLASLLVLVFGLFKAGPTMFSQKGYEMLSALPLSTGAIVASRFLKMYLSDLGLCLLVMVPGMAVFQWLVRPGPLFWLWGLLGTVFLPILPLAVSTLVGTAITAIASRMKHKALAEIGLSLLLILGSLLLSFSATGMPEEPDPEQLKNLAAAIGGLIAGIYPPAVWLGDAMVSGDPMGLLAFAALSTGILALLLWAVTRHFHRICRRLFVTSARHDYRLAGLQSRSPLRALVGREFRRYLASPVYVTNTIVGPILGVVLCAAVAISGLEVIQRAFPLDIRPLLPFALAAVFTMMPPAAVSISMEGKSLWIAQTLPLSAKALLDGKIAMNLLLMAPFYLVSQVLLAIALQPGIPELLWLLLIPGLLCVFAVVLGITINLWLHRFDWESEAYVVKQSAPAALGGFAGFLASLACGAVTTLVPGAKWAIPAVLAAGTWLLYRRCARSRLEKL